MKKRIFLILMVAIFTLSGCAGRGASLTAEVSPSVPADTGDVLEIKEKMFIEQCNDIYFNPGDYEDKIIKVEGMYDGYIDPESGKTYHYVIRNGPGCCGNDGVAGFEFYYDGNAPKLNDWIEAIGKVELVKEGDYESVVLRLTKLTVLDVRGAEYVSN